MLQCNENKIKNELMKAFVAPLRKKIPPTKVTHAEQGPNVHCVTSLCALASTVCIDHCRSTNALIHGKNWSYSSLSYVSKCCERGFVLTQGFDRLQSIMVGLQWWLCGGWVALSETWDLHLVSICVVSDRKQRDLDSWWEHLQRPTPRHQFLPTRPCLLRTLQPSK